MFRRSIFCLGLFLLVAGGGCRPQPLEYEVLERGTQGGAVVARPVFAVLVEEEYRALYRDLHVGELPPPPLPEVDFGASIVALVAMGEKPSAGYRVDIGEVARESERLIIVVRFTAPDPGRMSATVLTYPYTLIRIERVPALETVEFVDPQGKQLATFPLP